MVVPSYSSLLVQFDSGLICHHEVQAIVLAGLGNISGATKRQPIIHEIPVCYGVEFGPDLAFVAKHSGLTKEDVIARHCRNRYQVFAIGFTPGFCYLGGLDSSLATPRRESPRVKVASGSVGIAGAQTGIYPLESPGGWQLIGRTPWRLFDCQRNPPVPYAVGDFIQFVAVSASKFALLNQHGDSPA